MILRSESGLCRTIQSWGWSPHEWDSAIIRDTRELPHPFSHHMRTQSVRDELDFPQNLSILAAWSGLSEIKVCCWWAAQCVMLCYSGLIRLRCVFTWEPSQGWVASQARAQLVAQVRVCSQWVLAQNLSFPLLRKWTTPEAPEVNRSLGNLTVA